MKNGKQGQQKSYIKTDKAEYTLGDTIQVRGLRKMSKPYYGFDGKSLEKEIRLIIFLDKRKHCSSTGLVACNMILEEDQKNHIKTKNSGWRHHNMTVTKHELNDDGTFGFDIEVLNNYTVGEYRVFLWQNETHHYNVFDGAESQLFKIVGVA